MIYWELSVHLRNQKNEALIHLVCDLHSPRLWLTNGSFEPFKLLEKMRSDKTSCSKHINTYLNLLKHLSTKGFQHGKSFPTLT